MSFYALCYWSYKCICNKRSINFLFLWKPELRGMKSDIWDTIKERVKRLQNSKELILNFRMGRGGIERIHKRKADEGEQGIAVVQFHGHPGTTAGISHQDQNVI